MQLFIPKLGTKIVLIKPWTFTLIGESRNRTLWDLFSSTPIPARPWGLPFNQYFKPTVRRTLESGTILKFDRIYIRKEQENHDSITFKVELQHNGVWKRARFWARLEDVNTIEFERVQ
jgi:hypothetical protein